MSLKTSIVDGCGKGTEVSVETDRSLSTSDRRKSSITRVPLITDQEFGYRKKVDVSSGQITYVGHARTIEGDTEPVWQIYRILTSGTTTITEYAENNPNFELVWDLRESYNYGALVSTFVNEQSLVFDGVDEYLTAPDSAGLSITGDLTISVWVKPGAGGVGSNRDIVAKWDASSNSRSYLLRLNSSNTISFFTSSAGTSGSTESLVGVTTVPAGNWAHVAVTFEASTSTYSIYINGVLDTSSSLTNTAIDDNGSALLIGAVTTTSGSLSAFYNGNIDEIGIWDTVFTPTAISNIYNSSSPTNLQTAPNFANLVVWYRCGDNDTFPTISDQVGSNDLTMTNMEAEDIVLDSP